MNKSKSVKKVAKSKTKKTHVKSKGNLSKSSSKIITVRKAKTSLGKADKLKSKLTKQSTIQQTLKDSKTFLNKRKTSVRKR